MAPPAANSPFTDPDFGSSMVRVTDANTVTEVSGYGDYANYSYMTDSSAEQNTWSVFDPSIGVNGGYRFVVYNSTGWVLPFTLDATTMQVTHITGSDGSPLPSFGMMNIGSASFSHTNPDVFYTDNGAELESFNFSTDSMTPIYSFDECPGLPSYTSGFAGAVTNSEDDTKFGYYFGGSQQDDTTLAVYYDQSANNGAGACYWYDSLTAMTGGTDMAPTPVANGVGQLPVPAAPVVVAVPGTGSLPAGNYYVRITALTQMSGSDGETSPSPEVGPVYLSAPGSLTVTFPTQLLDVSQLVVPGGNCYAFDSLGNLLHLGNASECTPYDVYIGTSSGGETLQTSGPVGGTSYTQASPLQLTSAQAPAANTSGYDIHNLRMSKDGQYVRVDSSQGNTVYFWKPGTNQVSSCGLFYGNCGGHAANGYSHFINAPDNLDMAELLIRPDSNISQSTELVQTFPTPIQFGDSHWSWNDSGTSDTMPICGSFYNDNGGGDGTQDVTTNPLLQITAAYDREVVCVATSGPQNVWRFAHNRATGALNDTAGAGSNFWATPRGNVSQDGRFYMFTSDWEWSLGDEQGYAGCPSSGRCRTDVFIVALH